MEKRQLVPSMSLSGLVRESNESQLERIVMSDVQTNWVIKECVLDLTIWAFRKLTKETAFHEVALKSIFVSGYILNKFIQIVKGILGHLKDCIWIQSGNRNFAFEIIMFSNNITFK